MIRDLARPHAPWIALIALMGLLALARLHTYHEPFERDITIYAVIGHEMWQGRQLYSDLWDIKPPAAMCTFALAEAAAGYGPGAVYLLNVAAGFLILGGIYRAARGFSGSTATGLWGAFLWLILS